MIAYVVRGGKGERDRGEEKQEESEKSEGRREALQAAHEKRKFIFKYDKTMAKASSGVCRGVSTARVAREGEGGNEGEMM